MIQKEKDAQVFAVEKTLEQNKQQADGHLIRAVKPGANSRSRGSLDVLFKD